MKRRKFIRTPSFKSGCQPRACSWSGFQRTEMPKLSVTFRGGPGRRILGRIEPFGDASLDAW